MFGKEYTINEIIIGIIVIGILFYISQYMNITLFQLLLIVLGIISILYISQQKQLKTEKLQTTIDLKETNNKSLLNFVNDVSYFKLYNPPVYSDFLYKTKQYINDNKSQNKSINKLYIMLINTCSKLKN